MKLHITVDSKIRLRVSELFTPSHPLLDEMRRDMVIPNPAYPVAKRLGRAWNVPRELNLWDVNTATGVYSVPRGYGRHLVELLHKHMVRWTRDDQRVLLPPVDFGSRIELRDYQVPAVERLVEATGGVLEAPAGSGKTEMGLAIVARIGQPALWLTHTKDLAAQVRARALQVLSLDPLEIGLIGDGAREIGPRLTIGIIQTLAKMDLSRIAGRFGTVLLDECFPAGTLIDGKPIETIGLGEKVWAWDENSGDMVYGKVSCIFTRPAPATLLRISAGGRSVVCTRNHPFFTQRGWVAAGDLQEGDELLYAEFENPLSSLRQDQVHEQSKVVVPELPGGEDTKAVEDPYPLHRMQEAGDADQADPGKCDGIRVLPETRDSVLFRNLQGHTCAPDQFSDNGPDKPEICLRAHEEKQSDEKPGYPEQSGHRPAAERGLDASDSRWERKGTDVAPIVPGGSARVANRGGDPNQDASRQRIPHPLQAGHRQPEPEDRRRGRRQLPLQPEGSGSQERRFPRRVRVDSIEVLQPGGDRRFGGLCPDGKVYNLEVQGVHTYTANGFVVHNCHHGAAPTWVDVLNQLPARHRYGVTATPDRADGLEVITAKVLGPTVYTIERVQVNAGGNLITPRLKTVDTNTESLVWKQHEAKVKKHKEKAKQLEAQGKRVPHQPVVNFGQLINEVLADGARNELITRTIAEEAPGHFSLVLSARVEHCRQLQDLLYGIAPELRTAVIHAETPADQRRGYLVSMASGELDVLLAVQIAKEGLDIPRLDRLFLVAGGKDPNELEQKIGRIQRPAPGKTVTLVIDFVDRAIPPLRGQYYKRRAVYRALGMFDAPGQQSLGMG